MAIVCVVTIGERLEVVYCVKRTKNTMKFCLYVEVFLIHPVGCFPQENSP